MYAITSVSSSAYQMARVTNEVETQARNFAAPVATTSNYNQQASVSGAAAVQSPAPTGIAQNFSIASKASQIAPVFKSANTNNTSQQKFSQPQQQRIHKFNLEMVNQAPQNSTASVHKTTQSNNVTAAQKPASSNSVITESPYLIVVLNQNNTHMQKSVTDNMVKPPDKPQATNELAKDIKI